MEIVQKLLVVGCGNMGAALAAGFAAAHPAAEVFALDRDPERARSLLPPGSPVAVRRTPAELAGWQPDLVILALKPQILGTALAEFILLLRSALVISVAAGVGLARLSQLLDGHRRLVRAMPNLPVVVGQGMTTLYADSPAAADVAACAAVFNAVGQAAWVASEGLIDAATAIAGSGPAYFFALVEQLAKAGEAEGLPAELALHLASQTFIGAASLLQQDGRPAAALKAAVCSPRGTTEAGLGALEQPDALPRAVAASVRAAHQRAVELAGA